MAVSGKVLNYKQAQLGDKWDAIVIGSGMGGLTAAAMLSVHGGKRVLVLERHYTAGGFTHAFHRPGFDWDVGVHYIGMLNDLRSPVRRAFDHITNGAVEWTPMPDVYDRITIDGHRYDFPTGAERFRAELIKNFPGEARAIDRYLRALRSVGRVNDLYYAEKVVPAQIASAIGWLLRAPYLRWAGRTTLDVLSEMTGNRELIGVLTAQWGDYGLPPAESSFAIHATIAAHYLEGASYPVGGAASIAAAIVPLIERGGGAVVTSAEVAEILVKNGTAAGVRMADGREFTADAVVSDAGASNTFGRLLPEQSPSLNQLRTELSKLPTSKAHLNLYVGLDKTDAELGLNGTNLWIYPGYDHDENLRRFVADPTGPFPAVYISFPSAKDPDFERRHPGHSTIEAITPIGYDSFARWAEGRWMQRGADYDELKRQLTERLKEEIVRQVPQVAGHIVHAELSTPVTTRHFMNYEKGEIYGIASTPARFKLRGLGARTPVRNLYLTGQDATGLGVTGALFGGVVSASVVLGKNLMGAVLKPLVLQ
jgi:all-trans-retinol 13,14-reductase